MIRRLTIVLIIALFSIMGCNIFAPEIKGCTSTTACNYDIDATKYDGNCTFPEENFDCEGNCIATGNNLDGNGLDCTNNCGGEAFFDDCNVCSAGYSGHNANSDKDCNGDCAGEAFLDDCNVCSAGYSGHNANSDKDCNGNCFDEAAFDLCGECAYPVDQNTSCIIITDYDDNDYGTVDIGNQLWMRQNLKVTHYNNGDRITHIYNNDDWGNSDAGQYGIYYNYPVNADIYGNLYNFAVVDDDKGICPEGWHVPSDDEWKTLEVALGMSQVEANNFGWRGTNEGGKLKEVGYEHWNNPNEEGTNESGFTALGSGSRSISGIFEGQLDLGYFWTSSNSTSSKSIRRSISYEKTSIYSDSIDKRHGYSVRCIQD